MQFQALSQFTSSIINTVQVTVVEAVRNLKKYTYEVRVINQPKVQQIKGEVRVVGQERVAEKITAGNKQLGLIYGLLKKFRFPTEIKVSNFPAFPKFPDFPKQINVGNFPKMPEYPKRMEISNLSELQTQNVLEKMGEITKAIKAQKLDPKISVQAPPAPAPVVVPAPEVTVTQKEVNPETLAKAIAKVIPSIDYEKLAKAIAEELGQGLFVGGGGNGGGGNPFRGRDGKPGRALVDDQGRVITSPDYFLSDKDTAGTIKYTGNLAFDGRWYMFRINGDEVRYASNSNNPDTPYTEAWTNRASLEYDYADKVNF